MKKIDAIVVDINFKKPFQYRPPFCYPEELNFTEYDYKVVNKLFKTFTHIFPAFRQAWNTQEEFEAAKREWMKAFKQAKLVDLEKIKFGVNQYRMLPTPFAPSPGQFIAMCEPTPDQLGLPSLTDAWKQVKFQFGAINMTFTHLVIDHAVIESGIANLKLLSEQKALELFKRNYEISTRMFIAGKELKEIPKAIERKYYKKPSSELIMNSELNKMKQMLK